MVTAPVSDEMPIVRSAKCQHDRSHLWMNVAEDIGDAFAIKTHGAAGAGFVEAEVETLAVEERKDIVKEGILVRKLHRGARGDDEQMGREHLVFLHQTIGCLASGPRRCRRARLQGRQPDDHIRCTGPICVLLVSRSQILCSRRSLPIPLLPARAPLPRRD